MRLQSKFSESLASCPPGGSGVHGWLLSVANLAAISDVPPLEAEAEILRAMRRKPSPSGEVSSAIRKAYAEHNPNAPRGQYAPVRAMPTKPKAKPLTAARLIAKGDGADEAAWWEASPYRIDWEPGPMDAVALLETLYAPGAFVFCGERYGAEVLTAAHWIERFKSGSPLPPHWIPNPLTGDEHPLPDGKLSRRGDSAVASFRFAVAEFDGMSKADQLAFWWGYRAAPIAALIDSGGKSVHAILKVDAHGVDAWEADIERKLFGQVLVPLGCDRACRNEARLSRLPGHFRREKNAWQRLLYLDPTGTGRGRV